jgi:hypothetical protein
MQTWLWSHPSCPSAIADRIDVDVERLSATLLRFRYVVVGRIDDLVLPSPAPPLRANNLWQTTCFEAFLAPGQAPGYRELNFSPSSQWAAYDFLAYRDGMVQAPLPAAPETEISVRADRLELTVALSLDLSRETYRLGLAAVLEERGGGKSYWALNHPGGAPDFHHPACFDVDLPPAPAA